MSDTTPIVVDTPISQTSPDNTSSTLLIPDSAVITTNFVSQNYSVTNLVPRRLSDITLDIEAAKHDLEILMFSDEQTIIDDWIKNNMATIRKMAMANCDAVRVTIKDRLKELMAEFNTSQSSFNTYLLSLLKT